jgi:hypothetical protein
MPVESDRAAIADYLELARRFRAEVRAEMTYEEGQECLNRLTAMECRRPAAADACVRLGESPLRAGEALENIQRCAWAVWEATTRLEAAARLERALAAMEEAEAPVWCLLRAAVVTDTSVEGVPLPAPPPAPAALRLEVRGDAVYLDGEAVRLDFGAESRRAMLAYLHRLIDDPTAWVSGQEVGDDYKDVRWDRLFPKLPKALSQLIEAKSPKGRRLKKAAWRR